MHENFELAECRAEILLFSFSYFFACLFGSAKLGFVLTMELSKLVIEMENFIELINAKKDDILEIIHHLSTEVDSIIDQLKKFTSANQLVLLCICYLICSFNY